MAELKEDSSPKLLGAGKSGQVFLIETPEGSIARKIFFKDKLATLVHYVFFGSPNPYIWNEDILACAYYRRKILRELVEFWFESKLRISDAVNLGWNQEHRANQLDTEFIQGRAVALCKPFEQERANERHELVHCIMKPLQRHLIKSGFDGIVWQAGKGNPVALNNFLLESDTTEERVFVNIDVESGVPALFPLNPLPLFSFYIPKSIQHRHALFDDVDIDKLKNYVSVYQDGLENKIGQTRYLQLLEYIDNLEEHQNRWNSLKRVDRSIQYHLKKGSITEEQAEWYEKNPLIWHFKEIGRAIQKILKKLLIDLPIKIVTKLKSIPYQLWVKKGFRFIVSQRYRLSLARNYVEKRIHRWQKRNQLNEEEARYLVTGLHQESASDYLNDFAVHLGIKVVAHIIELLIPVLFAFGVIDEVVSITWFIVGGPIYRSLYTFFRMFQLAGEGKPLPWVALLVGLLPTIGDIAYPCQIIYLAGGRHGKVARFIVYDFFTRLGEKFPIWGGEDTLTEHFFNQCAYRLIQTVEWLEKRF